MVFSLKTQLVNNNAKNETVCLCLSSNPSFKDTLKNDDRAHIWLIMLLVQAAVGHDTCSVRHLTSKDSFIIISYNADSQSFNSRNSQYKDKL